MNQELLAKVGELTHAALEQKQADDLAAIRSRVAKATPGPWAWITDRMNDRHSTRTRTGGRRAKSGHSIRDLWVGLLAGPPRGAMEENADWLDEWDFPHVLALRWRDIKGNTLVGCATPMAKDADFIAHARSDIPELLERVDELRAILAPLLEEPLEYLGETSDGAPLIQCRLCRFYSPTEQEPNHAPACPVLRRDELLGRA